MDHDTTWVMECVQDEQGILSQDMAKTYRSTEGNEVPWTVVSASDTSEERGKGVKRKGGDYKETPNKIITFVAQKHTCDGEQSSETVDCDKSVNEKNEVIILNESGNRTIELVIPEESANKIVILDKLENKADEVVILDKSENKTNEVVILDVSETKTNKVINIDEPENKSDIKVLDISVVNAIAKTTKINVSDVDKDKKEKLNSEYMKDLQSLQCLDVSRFNENMLLTDFGKLVLIVRPWLCKLTNIRDSCSACGLVVKNTFENNVYTLYINGKVVAAANVSTRAEAQGIVEDIAWKRLWSKCVILLEKELFVARDSALISSGDIKSTDIVKATEYEFGIPLDISIASKMMKLMGWSGGGLGPKGEGISEPIRPHMQQVLKSGLGSVREELTYNRLKRCTRDLFLKYRNSDTLDVDLVFTNEFSIGERGMLHRIACQSGLRSKSYGDGADRFLVVRKKKVGALKLVHAVVQKGGVTAKYQVFIPQGLANFQ